MTKYNGDPAYCDACRDECERRYYEQQEEERRHEERCREQELSDEKEEVTK